MTRFYFDTRDNGVLTKDEAGRDLPDIEAAIGYAREQYSTALRGPGAEGQEPAFRVEIRTEGGPPPVFVLDAETASTIG